MISRQMRVLCVSLAGVAVAAGLSIASCAQTPPNVVLRTFQQAQKVDVVCIQVLDPNTLQLLPNYQPLPQNQCTAVPAGVNGAMMPKHLYAVVTQTTPGALAVVDLTSGNLVDVDRSTPGIDFIPVGANPTDVAVTPDGLKTFVSSADPNKMAVYAFDNTRLLGDSLDLPGSTGPLRLPDLQACALPQAPQAMAIVAASAQNDAGGATAYAPVVVLRSSGGAPAAVATIDPQSLGTGTLQPCALLGVTALSSAVPALPTPGPVWLDGVPYADAGDLRPQEPSPGPLCAWPSADGGGIQDGEAPDTGAEDATAGDAASSDGGQGKVPAQSPHPTSIALRTDMPILYVADDALPVIHVIDLSDPTNPRELEPLLATSVADARRRVAVGGVAVSPPTHDYKTYLYAIDSPQGTLMVYDVTDPVASPHVPLQRPHAELNPLVPVDRLAFSAPVAAVSFVQHDWPAPSQTEPAPPIHQFTGLLCNPNPNAVPEAGAVLDRGAYYRADFAPLIQSMVTNGGTVQGFPSRLRGIFAFATLSNGNLVTIDVDDWDAPCRRPDPMADGYVTGVLDIPEPMAGPGDLDAYSAPFTYDSGSAGAVTLETFFPVSAPNRIRSAFLLRADPTGGVHTPNLVTAPQLFSANGAPVMTSGSAGAQTPLLLPTPLPPTWLYPPDLQNPTDPNPANRTPLSAYPEGGPFPSDMTRGAPGVRLSFDDPTAHRDQDWSITYEGTLPTISAAPNGIPVDIASTQPPGDPDEYQTLMLSAPGAHFCSRGIEDWDVGQARAGQLLGALNNVGLAAQDNAGAPRLPALPPAMGDAGPMTPMLPSLPLWTADYVEIEDDLLPATDQYWEQPDSVNDCWVGDLQSNSTNAQDMKTVATNRYNACVQRFGATAATDADSHLWRDLPILHARDDSLEVGRFAWYDSDSSGNTVAEQTTNRTIVGADPSNVPFLRITRCCFHHQATFKVRTGGEWVAVGSNVGLLHHVKADASGACVLSCNPGDALLNARSFDVPWWQDGSCSAAAVPTFDRNSPLAMRNPMLSYVVWSGCGPPNGYGDHTVTTRDLAWRFSVNGSFSPQTLSLTTATTGTAVSPQSMRFIPSLGQLAVVDGEAQGLVLIDLNLVAAVHNYY